MFQSLDDEAFEHLEETLIYADVGAPTTAKIVERLEGEAASGELTGGEDLTRRLRELLADTARLEGDTIPLTAKPTVILVVGVNGTRQDHHDRQDRLAPAEGARQVGAARRRRHLPRRRVRAAHGLGRARGLRDRARRGGLGPGRRGLRRHRGRRGPRPRRGDRRHRRPPPHPAAPDGRAAQDPQGDRRPDPRRARTRRCSPSTPPPARTACARRCSSARRCDVDGIVLTKLDGTAKGGIALAIAQELGVPVKMIGVGEALEDLRPFDADDFAAGHPRAVSDGRRPATRHRRHRIPGRRAAPPGVGPPVVATHLTGSPRRRRGLWLELDVRDRRRRARGDGAGAARRGGPHRPTARTGEGARETTVDGAEAVAAAAAAGGRPAGAHVERRDLRRHEARPPTTSSTRRRRSPTTAGPRPTPSTPCRGAPGSAAGAHLADLRRRRATAGTSGSRSRPRGARASSRSSTTSCAARWRWRTSPPRCSSWWTAPESGVLNVAGARWSAATSSPASWPPRRVSPHGARSGAPRSRRRASTPAQLRARQRRAARPAAHAPARGARAAGASPALESAPPDRASVAKWVEHG